MSKWAANLDNKFLNLPDSTLHRYNVLDARYTAQLLPALIRELQAPSHGRQWQWHTEVVQPLMGAVLDMQSRGLLVDRAARSQFTRQTSQELAETDNRIKGAADQLGFSYSNKFPNSDSQVAKLLFGENYCGLKAHKSTEGGRASVDQDALLRVLRNLRKKDEPHRELLLDLCHRSRLQTMLERYTGFEIDPDGRCRASVKMAGTKTWRFSYADPALQQFPPETRGFFRANPGYIFVAGDFSQLEARWLAILAQDQGSLGVFVDGADIHTQNALDLLGYREPEWALLDSRVQKASRNFAKGFLYRISYGGEGSTDKSKAYCPCPKCVDKVPQTLTLTKPKILEAEARWFAAHPAVRRYHRELIAEVQKRKYYETVFGVRRYFARTWGPEFERELKNVPMQSSSALLMNRCQVKLHRMGAPIVLQHHDSFLLEVPERGVDQWSADLRGVMEEPVPELGGVVFPTTVKVGERWSDC